MNNMEEQVLSIEQMQELIDMGIDTSKASCCWCKVNILNKEGFEWMLLPEHLNKCDEEHIPTFTLYDILEMLPKDIDANIYHLYIIPLNHTWYMYYRAGVEGKIKISIEEDTLLQTAFNMLKWCKQNNHYGENFI